MNENDRADLDRVHALMMAALDGECAEPERRELHTVLAERPELAAEWVRLQRLKEVTAGMSLRQPPEEVWDRYRTSVFHRAERGIAWTLIAAGSAVLGGWALWEWMDALFAFVAEGDLPLGIRIAIVAIAIGLIVLLFSVLRERWHLHRRDPYSREVTR